FVVLKHAEDALPDQIVEELVQLVRQDIGAVAAFKEALVVARLPKTRSGKILRKTLRSMVDGDDYVVPSTIEDPAALDEIKALL
ncbi:MAG: AMP-binding enzyme, partial [Gammaproteobacteria bacterium]